MLKSLASRLATGSPSLSLTAKNTATLLGLRCAAWISVGLSPPPQPIAHTAAPTPIQLRTPMLPPRFPPRGSSSFARTGQYYQLSVALSPRAFAAHGRQRKLNPPAALLAYERNLRALIGVAAADHDERALAGHALVHAAARGRETQAKATRRQHLPGLVRLTRERASACRTRRERVARRLIQETIGLGQRRVVVAAAIHHFEEVPHRTGGRVRRV